MAGRGDNVGEIQALRSKIAQEKTQSAQLKQQAQASQQQAAQAKQDASTLHSQASSVQVGGGDSKEAQAAAERAKAQKEALESKAQAADQKARQLQDRFTQQSQQAQKLEKAVVQDEQKAKQLLQEQQKKKEQDARKPTVEKSRTQMKNDYKDIASIDEKLKDKTLEPRERYDLLKKKVETQKDLRKTEKDLEKLRKDGAALNLGNLKAECAFQGKVEARYEKYQAQAEGRIKDIHELEKRVDDGNLTEMEREKLEIEIGAKRRDLSEAHRSYEEDIRKERIAVKVEPWGSKPADGRGHADDCLERVLLNQGYTQEEIYKDDGALLKRTARENGIDNPDNVVSGADLGIAPSQAKLDEITKRKEHEGIVTTRKDGTVVREMLDGTIITMRPDGTVQKEYEKDGVQVTEESYEKDGAKVSESTSRYENGDVRKEALVEKDGIASRTVEVTSESDRTVEELAGEERLEKLDSAAVSDGEREKTKVTHVTREIIDTTKQPPEKRTVLDSTTYSQHVRPDESVDSVPGLQSIDRDASGQTLTFTQSTYVDDKGVQHESEEVGSTTLIKGKGDDGQDASSSETSTYATVDGRPAQAVKSTEFKGMFTRETAGMVSGVASKSDYMDKLQGDYLNCRSTTITRFDADGEPHEEKIREVGDYDRPDQDGNTVVIHEVDDKTLWTYRKVSDGGHHVQSQTGIEGTNARILNDTVRNDDGTFKIEDKVYGDDNTLMSHKIQERKRVDAAELRGDPEYQGEFLEKNAGKQMYEDRVMSQEWDLSTDNGKLTTTDVRQYSAEGSDDRLTTVLELGDEAPKRTSILESEGSALPARIKSDADGAEYSLDRNGQVTVKVDGKTSVLSQIETDEGPGGLAAAKGGADSAGKLYKALKKFTTPAADAAATASGAPQPKGPLPSLPKSLGGTLSAVGLVAGTFGLTSAILEGDAAEAANSGGDVAASLGSLSTLGSKMTLSPALSSTLGVAGKALGGAGAVLGIGYGYYEISQGNTVDGAFDIAGGVGAGIAVFAASTAWTGVGLVIAGGALVGKLIYDEHQSHKTAELEI